MKENEILVERISFLENRVDFLTQWINSMLRCPDNKLLEYLDKMSAQWKVHPDGDFDKTYSGKYGTITDIEYRDNHISINEVKNI